MLVFKGLLRICVIYCLLSFGFVYGQNKTIQHVVKKGENVYRLSLKYGVSMEDIYMANPSARELIKTGETLNIPINSSNTTSSESSSATDIYTVKRGETKYGLSKKFGMSITELENANPMIRNGLQAGHKLKIPTNNQSQAEVASSSDVHKVLKGETLWGISRQYNMSVEELRNLNKSILGPVLLENQVLIVKSKQENTQNNSYTVKKGDTKFGLAKSFNTTINELERLNPSIVKMLMAGDVIVYKESNNQIPSDDNKSVVEVNIDTKSQSKDRETIGDAYNWYVIQPKETLYSLSKKTNMPITELTTLNPKLKQAVLAGDSIKIKGSVPDKLNTSPAIAVPEIKFKTKVFWQNTANVSDNNIIKNRADYYLGMQNAIDTLTKDLLTANKNLIQISQLDGSFKTIKSDSVAIFNINPQPEFDDAISKLGNFEIAFLENGETKTRFIKSLASDDQMRLKMLSFLNAQNANIICLYDNENVDKISLIEGNISDLKLIKLNKNGSFRPNDLRNLLDPQKKNYVIIQSKRTGAYLSASNVLLKELSRYDIQLAVLNKDNIPEESEVSVKRFKILKLIYPMAYNPNFIDEKDLVRQIGFLVNYDLLNRITSHGLNAFNTKSSVSGINFSYVTEGEIIRNTAVSIFVFGENSNIELLEIY